MAKAKQVKQIQNKVAPAAQADKDQAGDPYARFGPGPRGCTPKRPIGAWYHTWSGEIEKALGKFYEEANPWDGPYFDRVEISVFLRQPKSENSHNVYRREIGAPGLKAVDIIDAVDRYLGTLTDRIEQTVNVAVRRPELLGKLSRNRVDVQ